MITPAMQLLSDLVNLDEVRYFENDVFILRAYGLHEDDENAPPCFVHKKSEAWAGWYKHIGRSMSCEDLMEKQWRDIIIECVSSLKE